MADRPWSKSFRARLSGRREVPPVQTAARGAARFYVVENERLLQAEVKVDDLEGVIEAHIHLGKQGENGPIVVFLLAPSEPVDLDHFTIHRTVSNGDLVGPLAGMPLAALVREMRAGNTYVNVHTTRHPDGEIRGQIREE